MKKGIILLFIFNISVLKMSSQKEANNWYFGNNAGITFNSGVPVALTNGADITQDNSSCISDTLGNVIFYTNGVTVWNKNNAVMYNGTGLLGSVTGGQSTLIVNQPQSDSIYYVFSLDAMGGTNGLHCSMVNMNKQSGLGAVTQKNVLLYTATTEKIDVTYNKLNNTYWVLTHVWNSNKFYAYKISSSGIDTTPVVSTVGSINTGGSPSGYNAMGQMTFSPDGSKLASAIYTDGNIELFDFNVSTGLVSNPLTITGYSNAWGTAFSSDGKKLYITVWGTDNVFQFDLSTYVLSNIMGSATLVGHATSQSTSYKAGYLQMGPDGKIYVSRYGMSYLGVIDSPNTLGLNCNFINNGVSLGTATCVAGLSRVGVKKNRDMEGVTNVTSKAEINIYPNPNNGTFTVEPNSDTRQLLLLFDINGRIVLDQQITGKSYINASGLTAGVYNVSIIGNNSIANKKLVIVK